MGFIIKQGGAKVSCDCKIRATTCFFSVIDILALTMFLIITLLDVALAIVDSLDMDRTAFPED